MEVVPNRLVDGKDMMSAIGEVMEQAEDPQDQAELMTEIGRLIGEGKGWSPEDRKTYLNELHKGPELPMFAESNAEMDPRLAEALAALKYEGETPFSLAEQCKENGNKNYATAVKRKRKMYYREALKFYTEGCLHACKAQQQLEQEEAGGEEAAEAPDFSREELSVLHGALLANRAACNLALRNFGSVKRDCTDSLKLRPGNIKAYFRKAKACFELRQYQDAREALDQALALEPENQELSQLKTKVDSAVAEAQRREQELDNAEEKDRQQTAEVYQLCTSHGAQLGAAMAAEGYQQHSDKLPVVCEDGSLAWPVLFLYPQYLQSDFIETFGEAQMLAEFLAMIFSEDSDERERAVWDEEDEYRCSNMVVYFQKNAMPVFRTTEEWVSWVELKKAARGERRKVPAEAAAKELRLIEKKAVHEDDQQWVRVHPASTLLDVLRHPEHIAAGGIPTFYLLPTSNDAHTDFLHKHRGRIEDFAPSVVPGASSR